MIGFLALFTDDSKAISSRKTGLSSLWYQPFKAFCKSILSSHSEKRYREIVESFKEKNPQLTFKIKIRIFYI